MDRNNPTYVKASLEAPEGMKTVKGSALADASGCITDEVYCERDGRPLNLQILLPSFTPRLMARQAERLGAVVPPYEDAPSPMYPLIVFIQGTAWMRQDKYKAFVSLSRYVQKGYAVASVEYRESANAVWPAQLIDVKSAIRFLKANADLYGIDKNRFCVMGTSSGGHLSLMTVLTDGVKEFDDGSCPNENCSVKCCVDFFGPANLTNINSAPRAEFFATVPPRMSAEEILLGGIDVLEEPEPAAKASPVSYVSAEKELPPILIMHGDEDGMVPFNQSVQIYEALKAAGKDAELYKVLGAGHGIEFFSGDVMEVVFSFLARNL